MPDAKRDDPLRSALFTDLYELTMTQACHARGHAGRAVFELFYRRMPETRNYTVAAGLEHVLDYLERLRFTEDDLDYLRAREQFSDDFLDALADLRFSGDVYAVPEGTVVFPDEPLVQVDAPMIEAQLVETLVLNQVHFQTVAASKAARVVRAAQDRTVVDFGSRRAHGADAALKVARATWLAGGAGTSNVLAGKLYGVPVFGTMAHSYVQSYDDERAAFEDFAAVHPGTTIIVDTYDTLSGVRKVIDMVREGEGRFDVGGVRLDSGDLDALSREARRLLDAAGLEDVKIIASSGLDEHAVARLVADGAPIDGFGVGTKLAVSPDATDLDMAYKLVSCAGRARMKLSSEKDIYPGRKQVFRTYDGDVMAGDVLAGFDEQCEGEGLLVPVMRGGRRTDAGTENVHDARERFDAQRRALPERLHALDRADPPCRVTVSASLRERTAGLRRTLEQTQ